jgi:hypothetical protein
MRKYIGNITIYNSMKIESDPEREKLRQELIESEKERVSKIKASKHKGEIEGKNKISESILWFLDSEGRPPANIPIESIKTKYESLNSQLRWLKALVKELYKKMDRINPEQANIDRAERERLAEEYEKEIAGYGEEEANNPEILIALRKAMRMNSRTIKLKTILQNELPNKHIAGTCKVEAAMRYLFADYNNKSESKITEDLNNRYQVIKKEADWLSVLALDTEAKLVNMREMVYACDDFLNNGSG